MSNRTINQKKSNAYVFAPEILIKSKVPVPSVTGKTAMDFHKSKRYVSCTRNSLWRNNCLTQETVTPSEFELAASCFPERPVSEERL